MPGMLLGLLVVSRVANATGQWVQLVNPAPGTIARTILLSDGTVMAQIRTNPVVTGAQWCRLTPDAHGAYTNGTWTMLRPMANPRTFFASSVLRDGRVLVAGGEYSTAYPPTAEVYDPARDSWTPVTVPVALATELDDANSKILPDGRVLVAPVHPVTGNGTIIFDPISNSWSSGAAARGGQDEVTWVKLPDNTILVVDYNGDDATAKNSERYIADSGTGTWIADSQVPVQLFSNNEIGPALLLPNGNALFLGGSGHTALYTPKGTTTKGTWLPGPDIPDGHVSADAPAAMLPNGKVLCAVGPYAVNGGSPAPTWFYEYDYTKGGTDAFSATSTPGNPAVGSVYNASATDLTFLDLPDGTVLATDAGSASLYLYVYVPDGSPVPAGKPVISRISAVGDGSYQLTGIGLNGISEGAAFGDEAQMDSNYPLVRLLDSSANVYYARTFNWTSTGVMTGCQLTSTEFALPPALPAGFYSLVVVANGIPSDPVPFPGAYLRCLWGCGGGILYVPTQYSTISAAYNVAQNCDLIEITTGTYHEAPLSMNQQKRVRLVSLGGPVTISR